MNARRECKLSEEVRGTFNADIGVTFMTLEKGQYIKAKIRAGIQVGHHYYLTLNLLCGMTLRCN